jgi:hypothetical protein
VASLQGKPPADSRTAPRLPGPESRSFGALSLRDIAPDRLSLAQVSLKEKTPTAVCTRTPREAFVSTVGPEASASVRAAGSTLSRFGIAPGRWDMGCMTVSQNEHNAFQATIKEIEQGADRAAAVVAGAFVDEHLLIAIKTRLASHDVIANDMFNTSGPLGTFKSRINMGFLIRLYSERAWKELDCISKVRNLFAHKLDVRDFTSQQVRDLVSNLTLSDEVEFHILRLDPGVEADKRYQVWLGEKSDDGRSMPLISPVTNPTTRERYIRACRLFIGAFSLAQNFERNRTLL